MSEGRFGVSSTPLGGLKLVQRRRIEDTRGFLSRLYCGDDLAEAGFLDPIVQINQSLTRARGSIRGMHFQLPPHAEDKFVSCLRGAVFDVDVDIRAGSPTLLRWHGEYLSEDNSRSLFIPKGFAHGFQTLTEDCELLYLHTARYRPGAEGGLHPLDARLSIEWPQPVADMSPRDEGHPLLTASFTGL